MLAAMSDSAERDPGGLLPTHSITGNLSQGPGKLKIFLGYAAGVGKTYRMLQAARDLCSFQRLDVVVGIIAAHRHRETAALVLGLELLPRKLCQVDGCRVEEFDVDAAITRRPKLLLVDDLAHSNAPGLRHSKRWQDIAELLDAGIDVYTTVNVQNIESLNDIAYQAAGIRERETVPDSVLDAAQSLELVDVAPEELLARLGQPVAEKAVEGAASSPPGIALGGLMALRELALRRTAQRVDDEAVQRRRKLGLASAPLTGEKLLVCVGPAPSSARLVRAAARLAAGLRCVWVAAYVESGPWPSHADTERDRLESHLRLAESLGATVVRLSRAPVAPALLAYARRHSVSRLVIGKPTHSRLWDRLRGSLVDEVVRGSDRIDVYVISGTDADEPKVESPVAPGKARSIRPYAVALLLVTATLGLALVARAAWNLPDPEMLFLVAVMVTAMWFGRGPSMWAAALGVGAYDFFFVPPYLTFDVSERRYVLTFAMMFATGLVLSELMSRVKRQERDARAREENTTALYSLSRELSSANSPEAIAAVSAEHLGAVFASTAFIVQVGPGGEQVTLGAFPSGAATTADEREVARWAIERLEPSGLGSGNLPGVPSIGAPLRFGGLALGALVLRPDRPRALGAEERELLNVFCREVAVAFERVRLAEEARSAAIRAKTEEIRASLLSAVSHDLRTPLASITGAATVLRDDEKLDGDTRRELLVSICDEAERLERLVRNLLDMTRLESGALRLKLDWVPIEELIGSALSRVENKLTKHAVEVNVPREAPLVYVDPVVFEQLFVNLFENAAKYSPPGSIVRIEAGLRGEQLAIWVCDDGPGVPAGLEEKIFQKFYRGKHQAAQGAGLGLAICRGIAEAHGGSITGRSHPRGGMVFEILLPMSTPPPSSSSEEGIAT